MKELNVAQLEEVNGGNPWLVAAAVVYVVSAIAEGYNEAHHEHC